MADKLDDIRKDVDELWGDVLGDFFDAPFTKLKDAHINKEALDNKELTETLYSLYMKVKELYKRRK